MLLSKKFVSDYIDLPEDLTIEKIAEDMTSVGNEYDFAADIISLMTNGKVINETFRISVSATVNSVSYYSQTEEVSVVNPSVQIPTDFKCEQTINQDQSETIKIAFTIFTLILLRN